MNDFGATLDTWVPFFSAQLSAGAALLGLLFVGLSLNLQRILGEVNLPRRALIALVLLVLQLVVTSITLIPGQSMALLGIELIVAVGIAWLVATRVSIMILRQRTVADGPALLNSGLLQACMLPYFVGAVLLLAGRPWGLCLLALAIILSFCKAALDAWVLVIAIDRWRDRAAKATRLRLHPT